MKLIDALQEKNELVANSNRLLSLSTHGSLSEPDRAIYRAAQARISDLDVIIGESKEKNSITGQVNGDFARLLVGNGNRPRLSAEYTEALMNYLRSNGKQVASVLSDGYDPIGGGFALPKFHAGANDSYEGGGAQGGYATTTPTLPYISPLAIPDLGARSVASVIGTQSDLKLPLQATFSSAGIKLESGGGTNTMFADSQPTLATTTLGAYMMGLYSPVSFELMSDVGEFQQFVVSDLLKAIMVLEDGYFVGGSGSGQPQGLLSNVGLGTDAPYLVESTGAYLLDALVDVLGTLKSTYFANAAWLMSRPTATAIRRAQQQLNLFVPVFTRDHVRGIDLLHGYPVSYSENVPNIPTATNAGATVALFGSFKDAFVIGDRGQAGGINVKVLDQPLALYGQIALLAYRRSDSKVRLAEGVQQVNVSHS
jgi:HK97 family phage major capsid protein